MAAAPGPPPLRSGSDLGVRRSHAANMTEQQLFEYLHFEQDLPVTRRMLHYAVMRREIAPTRLGNGNYFSKRDGLQWVRSRKR